MRTFQQRKENVYLWKEICDLHWERMLGEFWNDELFWSDLFHSMEAQDWEDLIEVAKGLQVMYGQLIQKFPYFAVNVEQVEKRLHRCDPVIKKFNRQGYNKVAVSLFMAVRDALNELNDEPTKSWTDLERKKIRDSEKTTPFATLFDY
jgi:hypothetical protein